ncbi:MAG TPA: zinc ribbon domain-containing protein [Anaerolineales bacterium]
MRKWVFPLLLLLLMLLPTMVRAQEPITISSLQVQIWPEYDNPSVLVIYQMTLSSGISLPASLSIHIPLAAGEPYAVAARQVDGSLYTIDYTRQVAGDWAAINFSTSASEIQLEFYDPSIQKDGQGRHYEYIWPGDYAVSQFVMQVQQPFDATDMRISPSLGAGASGSDELTYYTQNIGAIPAGQKINLTIDYQKPSDTLSVESLPIQPSSNIPLSSAPDLNVSTWLPWILGILGAGLIIGGIIWFWQTGRQRPITQARRRRSRAGVSEAQVSTDQDENAVYCSQCGKRALPGDQFCRYCGTRIRTK